MNIDKTSRFDSKAFWMKELPELGVLEALSNLEKSLV